jgi:putative glycosyltransferase (TIGR04372 family)
MKKVGIINSWQRHFTEAKVGGFFIFFNKILNVGKLLVRNNNIKTLVRKSLSAVGLIVTAPVVMLVVLVRPLVLLRFGTLYSSRIGHLAADVEAYLCTLDHDTPTGFRIDVICCPKPVCNHHLKRMWEKIIFIPPGTWLWSKMEQSCRFWTRGDKHYVQVSNLPEDYKYFLTTPPHLSFTKEEEQRGQELLKQLGIQPGTPWFCIHNRDSAYFDKSISYDLTYHNYRDFSIHSMIIAAEELTKRGYFVMRMGAIQREVLPSSNPMIIDYASSPHRSDFGDIYLSSGCSAYIGSDSGIACLPLIFRKPCCYVNFSLSIADIIPKQRCSILQPFITKHLFHKKKQRYLSVREMFKHGLYNACRSSNFEEAGVEVISNTPEEICDLAIEVDKRLIGQWQPHPDDEALQQCFWDIFRENGSCEYGTLSNLENSPVSIGSVFLRQNRYLLD